MVGWRQQHRQRVLKTLERRAAQFELCLMPIANPRTELAG